MLYREIAELYERLEREPSKLGKTAILASFLKKVPEELLRKVVLLSEGLVYPKYTMLELGVATQLMIRVIAKVAGVSTKEVERVFAETGDLGLTAEKLLKKRKQMTLFRKQLTVEFVFDNLKKIPLETGEGSQERKLNLIAELLASAEPKEARYLVRTVLGELRVGVAEGILRDAIVDAFLVKDGVSKSERERLTELVDYAWNLRGDFGEIAEVAKKEGAEGLKNVKVELGRPIQVMLAEKAESIEQVIKEFGKCAIQIKYDGMRSQVHKKGDRVWVFTRRLENVTEQFPDLVELCRQNLRAEECIVEGEVWAIDPVTRKPLPFQRLSERIHRKYNIEEMMRKIPIQMNLFDIVYLNGEMLFDKPLKERWEILKSIVNEVPGSFCLAEQLVTDDVKKAEEFYQYSLSLGQEGIMMKNLNSPYVFGRHVGHMYKIKPTLETLDLVIIGATWGTGKRAGWLSSFILGCRDPDTGKFLECGMMGTGIKEKKTRPEDVTFEELTQMLKPLIEFEKGTEVRIRPKVVVSVDYQEIQKSPNYPSGFALRFPRFIALRPDKSPDEADTIDRIRYLYDLQKRKK